MSFILSIIFCLLSFVSLPTPVRAEYQSAYNDYSYNYTIYRNTYNDYQVAKSTFLTYHTLASQSDAIDKLRVVLKSRNQVLLVYYNLLQQKLNDTVGVTNDFKLTFSKVRDSENSWLADQQKKIEAVGSIDDLNTASQEFENRYPQMDLETKQAIGEILLAKENNLESQLETYISNLNSKITEIRASSEDTTFADRGLINTRNKLELFSAKIAQTKNIFYNKNNNKVELFSAQQKLLEANQYLREAASFLSEIIKFFTG